MVSSQEQTLCKIDKSIEETTYIYIIDYIYICIYNEERAIYILFNLNVSCDDWD